MTTIDFQNVNLVISQIAEYASLFSMSHTFC